MANLSRLPGKNADLWDWQLLARCRGGDPEMFFHPRDERTTARAKRIKIAKAFCEPCPVKKECLEHALSVREPYGIWGGMSEEERKQIYSD
jgi:WhiB family redox-sensing transcriptional regulator